MNLYYSRYIVSPLPGIRYGGREVTPESHYEVICSIEKYFGIKSLSSIFNGDVNTTRRYTQSQYSNQRKLNKTGLDLFRKWVNEKSNIFQMLQEIGFFQLGKFATASNEFNESFGGVSPYAPWESTTLEELNSNVERANKKFQEMSKKYKNEIDHIRKFTKDAFINAFEQTKDSQQIKEQISNLEKDIENEKAKASKIIKRNPFVATILANRTEA